MHLLNFKSQKLSILKPRDFSFISAEPDDNLNVKFIQWLPVNENNLKVNNLKVKIIMPDASITSGLGEPALKNLQTGDVIQFERFGFVRLNKFDKKSGEMEFWFAHR